MIVAPARLVLSQPDLAMSPMSSHQLLELPEPPELKVPPPRDSPIKWSKLDFEARILLMVVTVEARSIKIEPSVPLANSNRSQLVCNIASWASVTLVDCNNSQLADAAIDAMAKR